MKTRNFHRALFCLITGYALFFITPTFILADDIISKVDNLIDGDLVVDGFELTGETMVSIHAVGAELKNSDDMYAYAWILNSDTRETAWVLADEDTRRFRKSKYLREYENEISLPEGRYEIYYHVGRPYLYESVNIILDDLDKVSDILKYIFTDKVKNKNRFYSEDIDDLMFTISAPEGSFKKFSPVEVIKENSIVDFSQPDDNYLEKKGFTLKKDMTLKIITIGEYVSSDRLFFDYGWIIDADSRKKIWQMDKWNTSWAGGGRKNRGFSGEVELKAGNYIACFTTDDSHSFGDWNTAPPYDPLHYGMMIYPANKDDLKKVEDFQDDYSESAVISLTRIRDDQFRQKGFTLKKETDLRILALGEMGYDGDLVDYGWIDNIADNEKAWEMTPDNTEHAGGGNKNRKFDGVITLPPGDYLVCYISDDSHSYRDWNVSAPIERDMWGISIYGTGKDFNSKSISIFDDIPMDSNTLVRLIGIGDDEEVRESFKLDKDRKIHIYALGEGRNGTMFDYGWIENAGSGKVVWEMTYRKSRYAGGGRKNREVNTDILLEAGKYLVYFITDDSHSFPSFNTSRPDNPQKWGITVSLR